MLIITAIPGTVTILTANPRTKERGSMAKRNLKAKKDKAFPRGLFAAPAAITPKSKAPRAKAKRDEKWAGKPGPKPRKQLVVKIDSAELKLINGAIKKSAVTKAVWLKDALIKAAQLAYGGEPTGKHPVLPPDGDVPHADDEDVDEVEEALEPTQPTSLAVHGPPSGGANFAQPAPQLSVPAPVVPQWQLGRVPAPAWQQPAPMAVPPPAPAEPDAEATGPYPNGQPPVQ